MLPKKNRISSSLHKGLKIGRSYHGNFFSLKVFPGGFPRFSAVVSKKVGGTAVLRNKIRKRAYSAVREIQKSGIRPASIVFWAKKPAGAAKFSEILSDISSLLKKSGAVE